MEVHFEYQEIYFLEQYLNLKLKQKKISSSEKDLSLKKIKEYFNIVILIDDNFDETITCVTLSDDEAMHIVDELVLIYKVFLIGI